MSDPPLFSIVVSTFARPEYLGEAVASVLAQTVTDLEVVVVDDHSPTPITPFSDPRVRIIRLDANGGPAVARNAGVRVARGVNVAFLDDDDLFTPDRLVLAVEGLARAPVTICWSRRLDESPDEARPGRMLDGDVGASIREGVTPHLGQTALRREAFLPFDEAFPAAQDVEWWIRMAQAHRVATVPRVGHLYRVHAAVRNRNGPMARVEGMSRMMQVHAGYFEAHPRARAFHLHRIGVVALAAGQPAVARRALAASLRTRPARRTAWHLLRAMTRRAG